MGMAATSSAQLKRINMGDDACHSVSLLHNGGGVSHGCRSSTRGVGAIGTGGACVVSGGDVVGTGGLCCGMRSWGERGTAFWGEFPGCGGRLGTWWAVFSMHLSLFDGLSSRAVAGACFEMAGVR